MSEKKLLILNLLSEAREELVTYLDKLGAQLCTREEWNSDMELTHILVDSEEQAKYVEKDFSAVKNNIFIIVFSPVKDVKSYLLNNGRLMIDPLILESKLGEYLLNKFFKQNHNIHLDESFGEKFEDTNKYEVINHLHIGHIIDEISVDSFEADFNIVSVRSFIDHIIIYMTYLKQAGLAGIPYEIETASDDENFAINIHSPVKNFSAEYMMDAFGIVNSKDPLQYILSVVQRSCDFLDVTFIENPARIVFTGFWTKSKKKLSGLSFNNILTSAQMMAQLEKKIKEYQPVEIEESEVVAKQDDLKSKSLPGSILEMVVNKDENSILNKDPEKASDIIAFAIEKFEDENPDKSINEMDESDLKQILEDYDDEIAESDQADILEKIQKKELTEAYDEELERVRSTLEDEDDFKKELSDTLNEEVAQRVTGSLDAEKLNKILNSKDEDDNFSQKIKGGKKEADDFKVQIQGTKKKKKNDLVAKISGGFEKKAGEWNVKINSTPEEKKKGLFDFVNSTISDISSDGDIDPKVKDYVVKSTPAKIANGLERYAEKMGQTVDSLSAMDLLEFKETELPQIISDVMEDEVEIEDFAKSLEESINRSNSVMNQASAEFKDKFKSRLESTISEIDSIQKEGDQYQIKDENISEETVQQAIKQTMLETFSEEFKFDKANKEEIEKKEKEIVQNLSLTLDMPEEQVLEIVKGASKLAKEKETKKVVDNIFKNKPGDEEDVVVKDFQSDEVIEAAEKAKEEKQVVKGNEQQGDTDAQEEKQTVKAAPQEQKESQSLVETQLLNKIKKMEEENKKLQQMLKAKDVTDGAKAETEKKTKEIDERASQEAQAQAAASPDTERQAEIKNMEKNIQDEFHDKKNIIEKAKQAGGLSPEESEKLAKALENEQALLEMAKKAESHSKKLVIEMQQKESLFKSEIERANKTIKAKDMVVEKAKESMKTLVDKKDKQVQQMKEQVDEMNRRMKDDKATVLEGQVKALKADLQNQEKMAEMYKNKVDTMIQKQAEEKGKDETSQLQAENRSLSRMKTQLENQYNSELKQRKSFEERFKKLKESEAKLRGKALAAESNLKNAENTIRQLNDQQTRFSKMLEQAKNKGANDKLVKELEQLKKQKDQLQARLSKVSGANVSADVTKELEQVKAQNAQLQAKLAENSGTGVNPEALKELEQVKAQNVQLQEKLKELVEKSQKVAAPAAPQLSNTEKRLEAIVKKLTTDLTKAKNEFAEAKKAVQKAKQEKTAMQNKMQMLTKELDKYKKAEAAKQGKKAA